MKKWAIALTAAVLTATLLTGCQPAFQPTYPEGVTKEKLERISMARRVPMSWYHIDGYGSYFLASENGYDIVYSLELENTSRYTTESELLAAYTYEIGNVSFYPCKSYELEVFYKGIRWMPLAGCYEQGLISEACLLKAQESFNEYMQILKDMEHDVYWQREKRFLKEHREVYIIKKEQWYESYLKGSKSDEWTYYQKMLTLVD